MRTQALLGLAIWTACSAPPAPTPSRPAPIAAPRSAPPTTAEPAPVDPIAALEPATTTAWLVPGRAQLELASSPIDAPGSERAYEVSIFARQGNLVRVALRLPHARFSVWTDRAQLLAVLAEAHRFGGVTGEVHATLRAGAAVRRLARKGASTHVRYVGALEVEGWMPTSKLAEQGPAREKRGRIPSGRRTLMLTPGAVIRAEPRWAGPPLALVANGHFVDLVRPLDAAWSEIAYADGDLDVRGYVSKQLPPGRVHRPREGDAPPLPVTPNAKVASGTCLYTKVKGEPIGYVVGDGDVALDAAGPGWWSLALDTPWGPITFAAHGLTREALVACAPAGSVPASTIAPPPAP